MSKKVKLIIDTDIGDDIDDAIAIAYALVHPNCHLLGITTTFRHPVKRAYVAKSLTSAYGLPAIPVVSGIKGGLLGKRSSTVLRLDESETSRMSYTAPHSNVPVSDDAAKFIWDTCRQHPGEVTLVAIGALSNVAMALIKYPELTSVVKEIVLMGGSYFGGVVEWNIACDPEAAHVVFESGASIKAVGLDVTLPCHLNQQQTAQLQSGCTIGAKCLADMVQQWQASNPHALPYLHDVVAIDAALGGTYTTFVPAAIKIELAGKYTRGATFNLHQTAWFMPPENKPAPNALVGYSIDADAFMQHVLFSLIS